MSDPTPADERPGFMRAMRQLAQFLAYNEQFLNPDLALTNGVPPPVTYYINPLYAHYYLPGEAAGMVEDQVAVNIGGPPGIPVTINFGANAIANLDAAAQETYDDYLAATGNQDGAADAANQERHTGAYALRGTSTLILIGGDGFRLIIYGLEPSLQKLVCHSFPTAILIGTGPSIHTNLILCIIYGKCNIMLRTPKPEGRRPARTAGSNTRSCHTHTHFLLHIIRTIHIAVTRRFLRLQIWSRSRSRSRMR